MQGENAVHLAPLPRVDEGLFEKDQPLEQRLAILGNHLFHLGGGGGDKGVISPTELFDVSRRQGIQGKIQRCLFGQSTGDSPLLPLNGEKEQGKADGEIRRAVFQ